MGGRKTFATNTVLTAADVQDFLMDQSVMVFTNADARGSAIPSPTEGMVSYLTASDSLEPFNGSSWVSASGMTSGNAIINGAFDIWQRGTTFDKTLSGAYSSADRVRTSTDAAPAGAWTHTQQTFTTGEIASLGYEAQFYLRSSLTTVGSATAVRNQFVIEDARTLAGQTVTLSFFAKSDSARTQSVNLIQVFGAGSPNALRTTAQSFNLTTSWQRFTTTFVLPDLNGRTLSANSWLGVEWNHDLVDGSVLDIWGVQLEAGSVANPFRRNANSVQGELAACQRYYFRKIYETVTQRDGAGICTSTTAAVIFFPFPVQMRIPPTALEQSGTAADYSVASVSAAVCNSIPVFFTGNRNGASVEFPVASGLTAGNAALLRNINTNAFLGWSAEL
jgi:hypothetical protein